jgi:hypothetical protein
MPLIKCPACGKDVSTQAASCPNCGHPVAKSPTFESRKPAPRSPKQIAAIVIILLVIGAFAAVNGGKQTSTPTESSPSTGADCRSDWTKCADNEELVKNYQNWSHIRVDCKYAANDRAKYGDPVWPWIPFETFYKGTNYITSGIAIAVEPDAQFSNSFGAKVHSEVTCTYDLRVNRVTNVSVSPR